MFNEKADIVVRYGKEVTEGEFLCNLGRTSGYDRNGNVTSWITVFVRGTDVRTAYPVEAPL
jgi:hypothetical protein